MRKISSKEDIDRFLEEVTVDIKKGKLEMEELISKEDINKVLAGEIVNIKLYIPKWSEPAEVAVGKSVEMSEFISINRFYASTCVDEIEEVGVLGRSPEEAVWNLKDRLTHMSFNEW